MDVWTSVFLCQKGVSFGGTTKAILFCEDHFAVPSDVSFGRLWRSTAFLYIQAREALEEMLAKS